MSGTPDETEVQTQLKNAVKLLHSTRLFADGTVLGGGGLLDVLIQSLEGEYTPAALTGAAVDFRAALAVLVSGARAREMLAPILWEYGRVISAGGEYGGGYRDANELMRALYEHFVANTLSVKTRGITFDTTATAGAGNVGNGAMARLTVDENGFDLEGTTVATNESKYFRCISDQNTGANEEAEIFESLGGQESKDELLALIYGSGERSRRTIRSHHAGRSSDGGSLLRNSSFSQYSATATPKFAGWTEAAGGGSITQDTTNKYRAFPGENTSSGGSLKITGGAGTVTLAQPITEIDGRTFDYSRPYFLRAMLNKTIGTASGGTVNLRLGSQTVAVTIAALASGWAELIVPLNENLWPVNFTEDGFTVEIEWASSTSGYLLVDDMILSGMDWIDGTWWLLRQNHATPVPWRVDDTLKFTDTIADYTIGLVQYWLWRAGFGYLPSSATPTLADPA